MIPDQNDTIAAVATPAGPGGVGIVRISGPRAGEILQRIVPGRAFPARQLVHGWACDSDGTHLDEVLGVFMPGPRSYTGEDVAEVHGHGGVANMAVLLRAATSYGARLAEAGEFTRRSFTNGRIDLVSAEAIVDVISAGSERANRIAQAHLRGDLSEQISELRGRITTLLAAVEAAIDFPEEGERYTPLEALKQDALCAQSDVLSLAQTFGAGRAVMSGVTVVFTGPVNAGKSSIFNYLVGMERALVSPEPGTTRDFIEARVVWDGIPVTLIDTAGLRTTGSELERKGQLLAQQCVTDADVEVRVHPADGDLPEKFQAGPRVLDIVSKADIVPGLSNDKVVVTSTVARSGLSELRQAILSLSAVDTGEITALVTNERHHRLLLTASQALERVALLDEHELIAIELRTACSQLALILGENIDEAVLSEIFSRFCIGK